MVRRRRLKSISVPIAVASITVLLVVSLLVGWLVLLNQKITSSEDVAGDVWLLVLGSLAFVLIMGVLVLFTVSLARGIVEVRKQDSFIDSVTHELKSPLASLQLCLETLGRSQLEPVQREQLRQMMRDDVDRLRSFIDDVLQANRLSYARSGILALSDVSLAKLVEESVGLVKTRHKLDSCEVSVHVDANLTVNTDRAALEIVVKNLIDNAAKYSARPAHIEVTAQRNHRGMVLLEVCDCGIGIEPKYLKRIFHRFYRVEDYEVRERRGTGLGLFVVSAIVRQLGGRVEALSEGKGYGTTVRVWLPIAQDDG